MEISIINQTKNQQWDAYEEDFQSISRRTKDVLKLHHDYVASVIFVDADYIHEINKTYRGIDRATDVISFALQDEQEVYEMQEGEEELGDIFINVEAVCAQAKAYGHSVRRECCFLFTHGLLHLLGFDHMNEEDEKEMFTLQDVILDEIVSKKDN